MASYNSSLIRESHISKDELLKILVGIKKFQPECGEDGYESCDIFESEDHVEYDYDEEMDSEIKYFCIGDFLYPYYRESKSIQSLRAEVVQIIQEENRIKELERLAQEEQAAKDKIAADALKLQKKQEEELKLYQKLQQKYG
jgi:hypothetical protein